MRMSLTGPRFLKSEGVEQLVRDGVERLRALPGVVESPAPPAACRCRAATACRSASSGRPLADGPVPRRRRLDDGVAGLLRGVQDPGQARPVVQRARQRRRRRPWSSSTRRWRRQFWPDGDPLNDRLVIGRGVMREFAAEPERQIIGVVGDTRDGGLNQRSRADDVHPAGAGAGRRQRAERPPHADRLGRPHAGRAARR